MTSNFYGSNVASGTLSTADLLSTTTGGTEVTKTTTGPGSGTGYVQVLSQGGTGTLNASLPSPSGNGWISDSSLEGKTILAGNWSANVALADTAGSGPIDSLVIRFWKRSSGAVYSSIGSLTITSTTINTTRTAYSFTASSMSTVSFATGDKLYVDLFIQATGWASDPILCYMSNSSTQGVAGDMQITTPSIATTATKSLPLRALIRTQSTKSLPMRTLIRTITTKSLPLRLFTVSQSTKSLPMRTLIRTQNTKSLPLRLIVPALATKSVPVRLVVRTPQNFYAVYIGGINYPAIAGSLQITSKIGRRSQASFSLHTSSNVHFQQYQQVQLYDKSGNLAFSGYIINPKEQRPGFTASLTHTIQCIDQHWLADKRRVVASYTNKTVGFIVQDIYNKILSQEGVTIGAIFDGLAPSTSLFPSTTLYPSGHLPIPLVTFTYCKVSEAYDALVKSVSEAGIPYYWMIDQNKRLWFVPYTYIVNPTIVDGTLIEQKNYPPSVARKNDLYRNTEYVIGGTNQTALQTETRIGNSATRSWAMGYDLFSAPTITVDGFMRTVGVKGVDSGRDFYWSKGSPVITQDAAGALLTSSNTLLCLYIGQFPNVNSSQNAAQIAYQANLDGTSGIVEDAITDTTLTSVSAGQQKTSDLLTLYGVQGTIFTFTTLSATYAPGQLITVSYATHAFYGAQLLIESVSAADRDGVNIWYTIVAIEGPYDTTWEQFFSKLLSSVTTPNNINIGVSQAIQLVQSFSASLSLTATLTATVHACPLPSTTLFPSSSLYPC